LVVIAAQADWPAIGRIRMRMIADASADSLHSFVIDCIEPGSTLHTDGWQGYAGLEKKGFEREVSVTRGRKKEASKLLPTRPPSGLATEAMAARNPSGRSGSLAAAILP
jgi:hypothetical protein